MATRDVTIRINAKDHASKVFRRVAIAAGAFLSLRQFARVAKQSLNLFAEQEKATQKLSAAIKATGGALGYTTRQMREYAHELQNMTTISNESFETAISIMATFRNVSGETFKRSIELAADMSVALGQDLKSSVIQLGKALNDPTIGLTALQRVGITFSETQKKLIKQLVEQNDLLGAQKVMLDELANQFSGQSKKAVEGYAGSVDQLKNSWDDAKKAAGRFMATDDFIDLQTNIRLSTILIENMGLTGELAGKKIKATFSEVQDSLTFHKFFKGKWGYKLSPETVALHDRIKEIQEELGKKLADRMSALIRTPDPDRKTKMDTILEEARLSAQLTGGQKAGGTDSFEDRIRVARAADQKAVEKADEQRVTGKDAAAAKTDRFKSKEEIDRLLEQRFAPQRMELAKRRGVSDTREVLHEMKKDGTRSEKAIEIQEDILRALEQAPVIQITNFN